MARAEFTVHKLNNPGLDKAAALAEVFSECLDKVEAVAATTPGGSAANEHLRCLALVRTKLQEACFFAKRAIAVHEGNQEKED